MLLREAIVQTWEEKQDYQSLIQEIVKQHNSEFNPNSLKRRMDSSAASASPPSKKLCISNGALSVDEFETKFTERPKSYRTCHI